MVLDNNSTTNSTTVLPGGGGGTPLSEPELIHAVILSLLWTIVVDAGIILKYVYSFKWRIFAHVFLMVLALVGTIVLVSLIIADKQPHIDRLSKPYGAHYVLGVIILAWVILQCLVGMIQRILLRYPKVNPYAIMLFRKIHLYSGYVLILLGKANVIIGWAMKGNFAGLAVCCTATLLSLGAVLMYIYWTSGSISQAALNPRSESEYNDRWEVKMDERRRARRASPEVMRLMEIPYCFK